MTVKLVDIRENAATVELDWADVKLLTHILRYALFHDVGSTTHDPDLTLSYVDTTIAFLEAAGMATWAHTVEEEKYTLERFARVVALTPAEHRAEQERFAAAARGQRTGQAPATEAPPPAAGKGGEAA